MLRVLALCCNAVLVSVMALGSLGRADIQRGYEFGMEFGAQEKVSSAPSPKDLSEIKEMREKTLQQIADIRRHTENVVRRKREKNREMEREQIRESTPLKKKQQ